MSEQPNKKNPRWQGYLFVILIIMIIPALSWYYLSTGLEFRKEQIAKLDVKGQVPSFKFINQQGDTITEKDMKGNMVVANYFFSRCAGPCPKMNSEMARIADQFKNRPDILFFSHTVDPEFDTPEVLNGYAERFEANPEKWHFLTGPKKALYEHARKGYLLPVDEGDGGSEDFIHSNYLVLVDTSLNIRNYYMGTDSLKVNELITHLAMIMPADPGKTLEYKPEKEK